MSAAFSEHNDHCTALHCSVPIYILGIMATSSSTAVMRVGFVGAGKMAAALARGFIEGKAVAAASQVAASCPEQDKHLLEDFER